MISIECDFKPDKDWNKRLIDFPLGTIYQTREYAEAQLEKKSSFFLRFFNSTGKIVGQILINEIPSNDKKTLKKFLLKKNIILRWNYGPVIFDSDFKEEICFELGKFLYSKKNSVYGSEHPLSSGLLSGIGNSFKLNEWGTFLIDLSQDSDTLWKKMDKHSVRKNIERSKKRGVHIKEINNSNLKLFYDIRKLTHPVIFTKLEKRWNILNKVGSTGFLAFVDEVPVAGIMVSTFNGYINEFGIARTERDKKENLYSHDLLKWHIIKWAKNNQFRNYDLTGINPNSKEPKEKGIFRYKKKWGGEFFRYNLIMK